MYEDAGEQRGSPLTAGMRPPGLTDCSRRRDRCGVPLVLSTKPPAHNTDVLAGNSGQPRRWRCDGLIFHRPPNARPPRLQLSSAWHESAVTCHTVQ